MYIKQNGGARKEESLIFAGSSCLLGKSADFITWQKNCIKT